MGSRACRGRARDALAQRDREIADHLLAVADGVADAQVVPLLAVEQDGEQVVGDYLLDDFGDVGEKLVQVERLRW